MPRTVYPIVSKSKWSNLGKIPKWANLGYFTESSAAAVVNPVTTFPSLDRVTMEVIDLRCRGRETTVLVDVGLCRGPI
jgi:hypothetical protein